MIDKLKTLIEKSNRIVVTAHLGPDADSVCSSLLLAASLKENFPGKQVAVCMEEEIKQLSFVDDYDIIEFGLLEEAFNEHEPDLVIICDANNLARCSRNPDPLRQYIADNQTGVAIIDHHQPTNIEPNQVYINQKSPAVTQDIYEICFEQLKLKKPKNYARNTMIGIYSDTGGFIYENVRYKETFSIVASLIEDGADLEEISTSSSQQSEDSLLVLIELLENLDSFGNGTYSHISDEFTKKWQSGQKSPEVIKEGFDLFMNRILRNVGGRPWGFVVYPDLLARSKAYKVSFRSISGTVDVAELASSLGGGGHIQAAGASVAARSVEEAIAQVKEVIRASNQATS